MSNIGQKKKLCGVSRSTAQPLVQAALPSYSVRFGGGCGPVYYCLVAWPLTYWPHKALCQFILSQKHQQVKG